MASNSSVVVLASPCPAANVITNALRSHGIDVSLIAERPVPSWRIAARRARRLGARVVAGQVLFRLVAMPVLNYLGQARINEILVESALEDSPVEPTMSVSSVNDQTTREILVHLDPAVIVIVGTRIISQATLACIEAPFVNLHAGLTPRYRGVHGGYWALVEGRPELVGSTVHLVDAGIDTGLVLRQDLFEVTSRDSFATYPFLHLATGVPLIVDVVKEVLAGDRPVGQPPIDCGESRLWYHPTLWSYLIARHHQGVR